MTPARIPPALARRIDRLSGAAHCFHRYAHHPLCAAYGSEVWRLGRASICRGCTLAASGGLTGLGAGLLLPSVGLPLLAALLVPTAIAGLPSLAHHRHASKMLTRFLPAGLAAFLLVQGLRPPEPARLGLAGLLVLGLGLGLWLYRRRGPDRHLCDACPEANARPSCPGFMPILRRERAFQRLAAHWISGSGGSRRPLA